jgi:hypothetical protein
MTTGKADARPTRAFFVRMLTRDITLEDCILDLVDNSIDSAWGLSGQRPSQLINDNALGEYSIDIILQPEKFQISDNCGGITLDDAADYAFTFGRRSEEPISDYTVGVYGIGMKRAVFKLGNTIQIISTYQTDNGELIGFVVPINVAEWVSNTREHWDFDLNPYPANTHTGVQIQVTDLFEDTSRRFEDPGYASALRTTLSRAYFLPLMRGLNIKVNGIRVATLPITWQEGEGLAPERRAYEDSGVLVEIVAGMSKPPPNDSEPEQSNRADRTSGWYVVCNGRAVLVADRTSITGWGRNNSWPSWHSQYNGFVGVVLFSAADPALLPMTTTKRSVDVSSGVYIRALAEMEAPTRVWIDYTNARKNEREQAEHLESQSKPVDIAEVQQRARLQLPSFQPKGDPIANVNYSVLQKRMRKLAAAFGNINMTYRDVGLESFEYAYGELVDEDD